MARRTLDHTAVRIRNLEQSRRFYEGILGLRPVPRPELGIAGTWYGLGDGQLHLIQADATSTHIDPTGPHFAIAVEDLDAMRRQLTAAGVEMPTATLSSCGCRAYRTRNPASPIRPGL
jgi:glyoxylase I family protein